MKRRGSVSAGFALSRSGWLAAIALLTVLSYAPALRAPFSYDDPFLVERSPVVIGARPLADAFRLGYWEGIAPDRGNEYRPLTILLLGIEHRIFGEHPVGYRLVSWLLHLACVACVAALARRLQLAPAAATAAAAVFAIHPIHVEAVTSIVGQGELMQTWLALTTVLAFVANGAVAAIGWPVLALAALLAKESAIVAPLLAAVVALWLRLRHGERVRAPWAALAVVPVWMGYFVLRAWVLGGVAGARPVGLIENPLVAVGSVGRLLAGAWLVARYAWLHVFPVRLSADYGLACLAPPTSPSSLVSWLALAGWCALAIGAVLRPRSLTSLLAAWFVLALAVVSNVVFPIGTIFGERLAYLASVAPCIAAGAVHARFQRLRWRGAGVVALCFVGLLAARTAARNVDYSSEERLFASALRTCPASVKARFNLAVARAQRGELASALENLDAALAIAPDWPPALSSRGRVLLASGDEERAADDFRQALALDPNDGTALAGLGDLARVTGDCARAEPLYDQALRVAPGDAYARAGLAACNAHEPATIN